MQQGGGYGQPPGGQPPGGGYGQPGGGYGQLPTGGGYGPPPGAPGGPPGGEPPNNIGLIVASVWLALGVMGCLLTGVAGAMSEQTGVNLSYIGIPMFVGGASAMMVAPFLRTRGAPAAIGGPIGCGCLGFVFGVAALLVFFTAIWPEL